MTEPTNPPSQPFADVSPPPFAPAAPPPSAQVATSQGGYAPAPPVPGAYARTPGTAPLPPGTELATAGKRIGGALLEGVLLVVTLGIGWFIWSLVIWSRGQTPAKQILGMRVYHLQNQRAASWGQMFVRQIVGGIVNGILYIGEILSIVFLFTDAQLRTVPDRIAGTVVLNDPNGVLAPTK